MDVLPALPLPSPVLYGADPQTLAAQARSGDPDAIEATAQSFESLFSSMLMQQMRQTLEENTLFGDDTGDILGGMFDLYLGQHLSRGSALGIGALVKRQLSAAENP
jgi:flagellar protein FlgJ